jgi:hypothetical protein
VFQFKTKNIPRIDPKSFNPPLLAELRKFSKTLDAELNKTTKTWQGEKPKFESQISLTSKEARVTPVATGSEHGWHKWMWLNWGTRVRYAIMTRDFKAKTQPGVVGSTRGRGGLAFIDVNNPQPGIEPRDWSKIILKRLRPKFNAAMRAALIKGAAKSTRE